MRVSEIVEILQLELNGLPSWEDLKTLQLHSYDILICMDWLEEDKVNLDLRFT